MNERDRDSRPVRQVWVMRHGETEWNLDRRIQGHADSPLTARGRDEARRAGRLLSGEGIGRIVASDLGRAKETALIVASGLGIDDVEEAAGWREMNYGPGLVGKLHSEAREAAGDPPAPEWRPEGGESLLDVRDRVTDALVQTLCDLRPTLVVTHAGPLRVLLASSRSEENVAIAGVDVRRGLIVRFDWRGDRLSRPVILRGS